MAPVQSPSSAGFFISQRETSALHPSSIGDVFRGPRRQKSCPLHTSARGLSVRTNARV